MSDSFPLLPLTARSIAFRKKILGVGINDADYQTQPRINGKQIKCPYYRVWTHMIDRCYSTKCQKVQHTYTGCTVTKEWLTFSNFKSWMEKQDWKGKALDKDLVKTGNKVYSADSCIFVARDINNLLNQSAASRGEFAQGVYFESGRFKAHCSARGRLVKLGKFNDEAEASAAYKAFKSKHIHNVAMEQDEPLRGYLIRISGEHLV